MAYYFERLKDLFRDPFLRIIFVLELLIIIVTKRQVLTTISDNALSESDSYLLFYTLDFSLIPFLVTWSFIFTLNKLFRSYDFKLEILSSNSRSFVYLKNIAVLYSFFLLELLLLVTINLSISGKFSFSRDTFDYISLWILSQCLFAMISTLLFLLIDRPLVIFILSTALLVMLKFDFLGQWMIGIFNPLCYAGYLFFTPGRPPAIQLQAISLGYFLILLLVGFFIFKRKDVSVWM
ncbi:hypothetical protein [Guggenheimella bovis]